MTLADRLLSFQSRLLAEIHGIADDALRRPEREGAWSIFDVIAHLGDIELLTTVRVSLALADDLPLLPALSQNAWVEKLHRHESLAGVLENFWHSRRRNLATLRATTDDDLQRQARHPSYGPTTVAQIFERLADHQERHLGQIVRIRKWLGLEISEAASLHGVTSSVAAKAPVRSPGAGIRIRDLWQRGVSRAMQVEFDPGAQWPGLDHHVPGPEEVFVVAGDFHDGVNRFEAGTFVHHPAGSSHSPFSENGCVLFVFYPEG